MNKSEDVEMSLKFEMIYNNSNAGVRIKLPQVNFIRHQKKGLTSVCLYIIIYVSDGECFRRSISLENIHRIADALEIDTYLLFI